MLIVWWLALVHFYLLLLCIFLLCDIIIYFMLLSAFLCYSDAMSLLFRILFN